MYLVVSEAGERRTANENDKEVKNLANSFCAKFGLEYKIMGGDDDNKAYRSCKNKIKTYFLSYIENDQAINTYTQFCKDNGIDATKCAEVIVYMSGNYFDMENVLDILKSLDVDSYIKQSDNFKSLIIEQKDWSVVRQIPRFEINKCMDEFLKTECKFASVSEKIGWSRHYKRWLAASEDESACSCIELFGIIKVLNLYFDASLDGMLKELCLGNYYTTRKVWTKIHYEAIVLEGKKFKLSGVFRFLKLAEPIAEAGWQSGFQDPYWKYIVIVDVCKLEETYDSSVTEDFRKECINLFASTFRYGFKQFNLNKYLQITDEVNDDFKRMKCKYDILNMIFDLTVADLKQVYKNIKDDHLPYPEKMTKFLISFDKLIFTQHMETILKVFKIDKGTDNSCFRFISAIKDIKLMFYHDNDDPFKNYLIDAKARGVSFDEAINHIKNLLQNKVDDKK